MRLELAARSAPDLDERDFTADRPYELWGAGITCGPTQAGFLYLALECELLDREQLAHCAAIPLAVFEFIEGWYNPRRIHLSLDCQSPVTYEEQHHERCQQLVEA